MNVRTIAFDEEGIWIEYVEEQASPFTMTHSVHVPMRVAALHPQVSDDLQELMEDAQTLLDAVLAARLEGGRRESSR